MSYGGEASLEVLDRSLLDQLETRWRARGVPIMAGLREGLTDEEMDSLTAEVGLRLPAEARDWWGWHDGATPGHTEIGPGMHFMSLSDAVKVCQVMRREYAEEQPPQHWQKSWFPFSGEEETIAIECDVVPGAPVPVYSIFPEDPGDPDRVADSLGGLVRWFLAAFDFGAWDWLPAENRWHYDPEKLPPELKIIGLT